MEAKQLFTTPAPATQAQLKTALAVVVAVTEAIRELGEVPIGHMYAQLMDKMDLATYEKVIGTIVGAGLIERRGGLLRWTGPEFRS